MRHTNSIIFGLIAAPGGKARSERFFENFAQVDNFKGGILYCRS